MAHEGVSDLRGHPHGVEPWGSRLLKRNEAGGSRADTRSAGDPSCVCCRLLSTLAENGASRPIATSRPFVDKLWYCCRSRRPSVPGRCAGAVGAWPAAGARPGAPVRGVALAVLLRKPRAAVEGAGGRGGCGREQSSLAVGMSLQGTGSACLAHPAASCGQTTALSSERCQVSVHVTMASAILRRGWRILLSARPGGRHMCAAAAIPNFGKLLRCRCTNLILAIAPYADLVRESFLFEDECSRNL